MPSTAAPKRGQAGDASAHPPFQVGRMPAPACPTAGLRAQQRRSNITITRHSLRGWQEGPRLGDTPAPEMVRAAATAAPLQAAHRATPCGRSRPRHQLRCIANPRTRNCWYMVTAALSTPRRAPAAAPSACVAASPAGRLRTAACGGSSRKPLREPPPLRSSRARRCWRGWWLSAWAGCSE